MTRALLLGLLGLCLSPVAMAAERPLLLAWQGAQGKELLRLDNQTELSREPLPDSLQAPLGSLWKLFVYAYLEDTGQAEVGYQCRGEDSEEVYCCAAGQRIERESALQQSCGLYFEQNNLHLSESHWRSYWQARQAPTWISERQQLAPQTRVAIGQLLDQLGQLPAQQSARKALLDVVLHNAEGATAGVLGARLRVKTWSWLADNDAQARQGGFAGWLVDGTPLWAGGSATGSMLLKQYAGALQQTLPNPWPEQDDSCVQVNLFARYPLRKVLHSDSATVAIPGPLEGHYQVEFANGNHLSIESHGELFLQQTSNGPQLTARLNREEYVARVLQREAASSPPEAAKALAVAIRSYLLQNAERQGQCLSIDDSSSSQRVAPRPASQEARNIAAWTSDLVLAGASVSYHRDRTGNNRLAWRQAVAQAKNGMRYDAILLRAFPLASLSRWDNPQAACQPLATAKQWLDGKRRDWRQRLSREAGYEELSSFSVCQLNAAHPYADQQRLRIFVRGLFSLQDRLDLTHEYLHLAFAAHPNGQDEAYIETLARTLLLE